MKYTEEQLSKLCAPASTTEDAMLEHAKSQVLNALNDNHVINSNQYEVFGQGSYKNNTNVRKNSDVDINVCYTDAYYYDIPNNMSKVDFGFINPVSYTYKEYKNDIEKILVDYFGRENVVRKNKCINIKSNTYRASIDVVPTWKYRNYRNLYSYDEGVYLFSDNYERVINYPKQHFKNGVNRNNETCRRYKRLVRIFKNLCIKMKEDRYYINDNINSFLIECLIYNVPIDCYSQYYCDWNLFLKNCIGYLWNETKFNNNEMLEVSELLPVFQNHKWSYIDVNNFMYNLWNYLEYGD